MKRFSLVLLLSFVTFINISAQSKSLEDVYSTLTNEDGYWLLYCERIEQYDGQEYIAKETYYPLDDVSSIMLEDNGAYHIVDSDYNQSQVQWSLTDDYRIEMSDSDNIYFFDLIKVEEPFLSMRYFEDRGNLKMCKISIYCRPGYRLSEDEVQAKNDRGVFDIDGFTKTIKE